MKKALVSISGRPGKREHINLKMQGEPMESKSILIVDDDKMIRNMLMDFFRDLRYQVVTADSRGDALQKFAPETFDIVISDFVMPDTNGIELLKEFLKKDDKVLFLSLQAIRPSKQPSKPSRPELMIISSSLSISII